MAIEISDKAVEEVRRMMHKEGVQAAGLRVGIKGGGCSGLSYNLAFVQTTQTPLKHQFELETDAWQVIVEQMERRLKQMEDRRSRQSAH